MALGSLRADDANLVVACRRIIARHPEAGALWWLCAHLLTSDDPDEMAWALADEIETDPAPRSIAVSLPERAKLLTIGWPEISGAALMRRGDAVVYCADSRHEASSFMQRLERVDIECEPIPAESLARVASQSDVVLVDAAAACPGRVLAPVGSHVVAAVARSVGTPVWLTVGLGRRLPDAYVDEIADRLLVAGGDPWDLDVDDIPVELISHVASADGVTEQVAAALRPDCPFAPELLRPGGF